MTLKEMKIKAFSLIEEYYPEEKKLAEDEDVKNKINGVVNQIQNDLMPYRKISAVKEIEIHSEDSKKINVRETIKDCYQLNKLTFDKEDVTYDMPDNNTIILPNDFEGKVIIYYYKYPRKVELEPSAENYDETFEFELDDVLLEIMPYGIASDLLKMDMISNYGKYFYERYLEMKNRIDPRTTNGIVSFEGGIDV